MNLQNAQNGLKNNNQNGYSQGSQQFTQGNHSKNQQSNKKGLKPQNINNYQNQYYQGGQSTNNSNQRYSKSNNNFKILNNISNSPITPEQQNQQVIHQDQNQPIPQQQAYRDNDKKNKNYQQQNRNNNKSNQQNASGIQQNIGFFQENNTFNQGNSQNFRNNNNSGIASNSHNNQQNQSQNQQPNSRNNFQNNFYSYQQQQQPVALQNNNINNNNSNLQPMNSLEQQIYQVNPAPQQHQGYRKNRSNSFNFCNNNNSNQNNVQTNSKKKKKKQKLNILQQQQQPDNSNQQQYTQEQFQQKQPIFTQNQVQSNIFPKQKPHDKTKKIQKKQRGVKEINYSKEFIIKQYKKYKKLKQKMNKSQATPKITTQALMNNQMNDFKEMSKSIQQIEENRQKKLSDSNFEDNVSVDFKKADEKQNNNNELTANPNIDINEDIFPSQSNNFSMLDSILENDEKKKEFYNKKVAQLLDANGCSDTQSLKKIVQALVQKLNKKSDKIRKLKIALQKSKDKKKKLKLQLNGKIDEEEEDEEFSFEDAEFDDHDDDEDLYAQNMEQEYTMSENCYDSDDQIDQEEDEYEAVDEDQFNEFQEQNTIQEDESEFNNINNNNPSQNSVVENTVNTNMFDMNNDENKLIQPVQINQQQGFNSNRPRVLSNEDQDANKKKSQKKNINKQFNPIVRLIKQISIGAKEKQNEGDTNLEQITFQNLRTTSEPVLIRQDEEFCSNTSLDKRIKQMNIQNSSYTNRNNVIAAQSKQDIQQELSQNDNNNDQQRKKSNSV
ncbi:hypothetical protein ABPG72_003400 [Tetrahymena utriculariae]